MARPLAAFVMKPVTVLDRSVRGTRVGHQGATGGGWPEPDAATRCHGARWEISYVPYTCVTCRLHVCLPDMKIVTRQFAARVGGVPGRRPPRSRRVAPSRSERPRLADGRSPEGTRAGSEALRSDEPPCRADRVRFASAQGRSLPQGGRGRRPAPRNCYAAACTLVGRALAACWGDFARHRGGADESCRIRARNPCLARAREPVEGADAAR